MKKKDQIMNLILEVESMSKTTGLSVVDIYKEVLLVVKDKKLKSTIEKIIKQISNTGLKWKTYQPYIDDKVLLDITRKTEEKGLPIGDIFEEYKRMREKTNEAKSKIKGVIVRPLVIFFMVSIVALILMKRTITILSDMKADTSMIELIMYFHIFIMVSLPVIIILAFVKFPHKLPYLKTAFKEIDGYRFLSLFVLFYDAGLTTRDIANFFKSSTKLKVKGQDLEFIVNFFRNYLSDVELGIFRMGVKMMKVQEVSKSLLQAKELSFTDKVNNSVSVLGEVSILFAVPPVVFIFATLALALAGISSKF